jgi:membrane associated rhomboid family serine protease
MNTNVTPMVKNLLIINIGIFIIGLILQADLGELFGLRYINAPEFKPYQLLTHMFIHANFSHLFSNMFALFMFGPMLENVWGAKKFLVFYMICGLGAALLHSGVTFYEVHALQKAAESYLSHPDPTSFEDFVKRFASGNYTNNLDFMETFRLDPANPEFINETKKLVEDLYFQRANIPMVGASGAIFGILMGFGMLFPNTVLMLMFFPVPVKAKYFIGFYALVELFTGVYKIPGDNIAHFAHLGGMAIAFIIIRIWNIQRNSFY